MNMAFDPPSSPELTRRRKAAMIVQMLMSDGDPPSIKNLPEALQELLTSELSAVRLVNRDTVTAVAEEFVQELEAVGLTSPGTRDGAILSVADHLSPNLAERLRAQTEMVRNGDHWPAIAALDTEKIVKIMTSESIPVCAVALSKLPVAKAAEVLQKTPGDRARRITFAMSQTADVTPDTVQRIGAALATDYAVEPSLAFEKAPVQRLGAILNSTASDAREDVLAGLDETDPVFAGDVRKAIFTFKDIAARLKPTDVPNCIRSVDTEVLTRAIAAALKGEDALRLSAEFMLKNLSQRMAGQIEEDAAEMGRIRKDDAEAAMTEVTKAIRDMVDAGAITLIDPDESDDENDE